MAPISLTDSTSPPRPRSNGATFGTTPTRKSHLTGTQALWDPYEALDVYPNRPGFSCFGIAFYSNARCRWRFLDVSIRTAACASLDSIAAVHPSKVTRRSLEILAESVLCDNHKNQAYDTIAVWDRQIERYLTESKQQSSSVTGLESQTAASDALDESLNIFRKQVENVEKELEKLKAERDEARNACTKQETEAEKLRSQQAASSQRSELVEKRLKAKIMKSETIIDSLQSEKKAASDEMTSLSKELLDFKTSANTRSNEIERLKQRLSDTEKASKELAATQATESADLKNQLTASQETSAAGLQRLKDQSSTHTAQVRSLEVATQDLRERHARTERRLEKVESQVQELKGEKYVTKWRHAVQIMVQRREHDVEKVALEKKTEGWRRRAEDAEERLKEREQLLSSLKLQNIKKGVCAVVTTRPFKISIRRATKIRETPASG